MQCVQLGMRYVTQKGLLDGATDTSYRGLELLAVEPVQGSAPVRVWNLSEMYLGLPRLGECSCYSSIKLMLVPISSQSCSSSSPCSGEFECVSGVCKPCTWGCHGTSQISAHAIKNELSDRLAPQDG